MRKNKKRKLSILFARSKICGFFMKASSFLFGKAESSMTAKTLTSYNEESFKKGFLYKFIEKIDVGRVFFRPLKRNVSKYVSQSLLINKFNSYLQGFLFTKLNVYGIIFMTTGIGFLLVRILKVYINSAPSIWTSDTFVSLLLVLLSLPLLFSSVALNTDVCRSKMVSVVLFDWLGCKKESFEREDNNNGHAKTVIPLGLLLCVLSWWVRPIYIIAAVAVLIAALAVCYSPESGIVGLIAFLPFLTFERLSVFVIYILACFLLKYIRGKRTVKVDPLSFAVLVFGILSVLCYKTSYLSLFSKNSTMQMACSVCVFLLTVNLIKSKKWIKRCVKSVCIACFFVVVYAAVGYMAESLDVQYLKELFNNSTVLKFVSYFANTRFIAQYLLLALPLVIVNMKDSSKKQRAGVFVTFVLGLLCLGIIGDFRSIICLMIGFSLIFLLYSKKSMAILLGSVCIIPVLCLGIKSYLEDNFSLFNRLFDFGLNNITGTEQLVDGHKISLFFGTGLGTYDNLSGQTSGFFYTLAVEVGLLGVILFFIMLFLCLQKNMTLYSKGCSSEGRLVSLTCMASAFALLCRGTDVNIFEDYRVNIMFWVCIALSSCVSVTERKIIYSDEMLVE